MHAVTQFVLAFTLHFLAFSSLFFPSEAMSLFAFWLVRLETMELIRFSVYTGLSLFYAFSFKKKHSCKYTPQTAKSIGIAVLS